ncbi:hypothetical protein PM082_018189 [Marasmius tenuissimus]|nr:hypothetical protein PM082_018189 [Marasmius tenuissimus]
MSSASSKLAAFERYLSSSHTRFSTADRAIEQLKKHGPPSVAAAFNYIRPGGRVEAACQAIVVLSDHMSKDVCGTSQKIQTCWKPRLFEWVTFFLRALLTSTHIETEVVFRDPIIFSLPDLLDFDNKSSHLVAVKKASSSYLQPLLSQTWIFMADTRHPHMAPWSALLTDVTVSFFSPSSAATRPFGAPPNDPRLSELPHPYQVNAALGKKLLRYLEDKFHRLEFESTEGGPGLGTELEELKLCIILLDMGSECFADPLADTRCNPICIGEDNYKTAIRLMCRILRFFLRKFTWLYQASIERHDEVRNAYLTVGCILLILVESVSANTPGRVQHMIESGIIKSLFYADNLYYIYKLGEKGHKEQRDLFPEGAAKLLDRIAVFIVHYSVLRAWIREVHSFWRTEGILPRIRQSGLLEKAWNNVLGKVEKLDLVRYNLKCRGMCAYEECPLFCEEGSKSNLTIQYLRCTGCSTAIYCSRACRKLDWKYQHKVQCFQRPRALHAGGIPDLGHRDHKFFGLIVSFYVQTHFQVLTTMVYVRRLSNPSPYPLQNRNPFLCLDFRGSKFPLPGDPTLLSKSTTEDTIQREWVKTGLNELLVIAIFPLKPGATEGGTSIARVFDFPLEGLRRN